MEWYVIIEGERHGPMSKASVQRLIEIGVVKANTPARRRGMSNWLQIAFIRDFELGHADVAAGSSPQTTQPNHAPDLIAPARYPHYEPRSLWQRLLHFVTGKN